MKSRLFPRASAIALLALSLSVGARAETERKPVPPAETREALSLYPGLAPKAFAELYLESKYAPPAKQTDARARKVALTESYLYRTEIVRAHADEIRSSNFPAEDKAQLLQMADWKNAVDMEIAKLQASGKYGTAPSERKYSEFGEVATRGGHVTPPRPKLDVFSAAAEKEGQELVTTIQQSQGPATPAPVTPAAPSTPASPTAPTDPNATPKTRTANPTPKARVTPPSTGTSGSDRSSRSGSTASPADSTGSGAGSTGTSAAKGTSVPKSASTRAPTPPPRPSASEYRDLVAKNEQAKLQAERGNAGAEAEVQATQKKLDAARSSFGSAGLPAEYKQAEKEAQTKANAQRESIRDAAAKDLEGKDSDAKDSPDGSYRTDYIDVKVVKDGKVLTKRIPARVQRSLGGAGLAIHDCLEGFIQKSSFPEDNELGEQGSSGGDAKAKKAAHLACFQSNVYQHLRGIKVIQVDKDPGTLVLDGILVMRVKVAKPGASDAENAGAFPLSAVGKKSFHSMGSKGFEHPACQTQAVADAFALIRKYGKYAKKPQAPAAPAPTANTGTEKQVADFKKIAAALGADKLQEYCAEDSEKPLVSNDLGTFRGDNSAVVRDTRERTHQVDGGNASTVQP